MTNEGNQKFGRLKAIFDEDGAKIREQFIYAGLLLTIFERFKTYVIDRVDEFFSTHVEVRNGSLKYIRGSEFKNFIKKYGSGLPGQHNNQVFRTALHWIQSLNAISKDDLVEIERLYSLRNEVGHEMLLILADDNKKPITFYDVLLTYSVYVRIVRWWWKEIECATDPDMTQEKHDSIDWDNIESTDTMILREILNKSLSDNPIWQNLQTMGQEAAESQS
ncbi:hypothetical protein Gdia_2615 [Gluconacetobacter diazotrophicus PA1 5]|uniref:hypothetical protein n=1 Tax=Gluconacetobacter diazotrophicus TaxID=33996 RepID=UPI000173D709|nr:hypothetical protein [Gluconacetobacter diazotrophicus]ACI52357.1 hypothetical protein Gdia_2615 [Gluconacetobacter diazotrophicus PA1 5]TWB05547.1 hypothetical protein FBZ86_11640 [Gluconacetobacter diazotrophicus]